MVAKEVWSLSILGSIPSPSIVVVAVADNKRKY
jgi:hypothetical protein